MVLTLGIPLRHVYGLKDLITGRHLDVMAKVMLTTGLVVGYGYLTEIFLAWYSGDHFEWYMMKNRFFGPYAFVFWLLMLCNIAAIQPLWFKPVRQNIIALFVISMFVNFGMWFERFMIIVMSLHRDFLPSSWGMYTPTHVDIAMFAGTIGFFLLLFFLFVRALPMISIMEMREYVSIKRGDKAASADWKPYKPAVDGEPQPVVVPGAPLPVSIVSRGAPMSSATMSHSAKASALFGVMGEYSCEHDVVHAAKKMYELGYRKMDGYTPFPVHGLDTAIGRGRTKLPMLVLAGGIAGMWQAGHDVVQLDDPLPDQRRRPPLLLLADVRPDHVRVHDPARVVDGGVRDARAEQPPGALPPDVQRTGLSAGQQQHLLSLRRIDGCEFRRREAEGRLRRHPRRGCIRSADVATRSGQY